MASRTETLNQGSMTTRSLSKQMPESAETASSRVHTRLSAADGQIATSHKTSSTPKPVHKPKSGSSSNEFPGPFDADSFLSQVESAAAKKPFASSPALSSFNAINHGPIKRKGADHGESNLPSKLARNGPSLRDSSGLVYDSASESKMSAPTQSDNGIDQRSSKHSLRFRPQGGHDYKTHILELFRIYEKLHDCEEVKEWTNKTTLRDFSSYDLESLDRPVYFRAAWAGREFKGSPYYNMEAALTHISGTELPESEACEQCTRGSGPFTTCVVREGMHKGACSNCAYNSQASKCSFREKKPLLQTGSSRQNLKVEDAFRLHDATWERYATIGADRPEQANGPGNYNRVTSKALFVSTKGIPSTVTDQASSGANLYMVTPEHRIIKARKLELHHKGNMPARSRSPQEDPEILREMSVRPVRNYYEGGMPTRLHPENEVLACAASMRPLIPTVARSNSERLGGSVEASTASGSYENMTETLRTRQLARFKPTSAPEASQAESAETNTSSEVASIPQGCVHEQPKAGVGASSMQNMEPAPQPQRQRAQPRASDGDSSAYTTSFLDYVTLVVTVDGDPTVIEMGLGGCSTLDALLRKLTNARSLRRIITDHLAIVSIELRVVDDQTAPVTVLEPGDVTLYARLLRNVKMSFEKGGREEMALHATIELATRAQGHDGEE